MHLILSKLIYACNLRTCLISTYANYNDRLLWLIADMNWVKSIFITICNKGIICVECLSTLGTNYCSGQRNLKQWESGVREKKSTFWFSSNNDLKLYCLPSALFPPASLRLLIQCKRLMPLTAIIKCTFNFLQYNFSMPRSSRVKINYNKVPYFYCFFFT